MEQIAFRMERTDKSLIEAHCGGCETAFTEVVGRYGGIVLGYLVNFCGDRQLAEDYFQETFQKAYLKANTFRGANLKPWLLTISTRVAIDGLRRNKKFRAVSLEDENCSVEVVDPSCDPLAQITKEEARQRVRIAIEKLPARQRATLLLAYYQQMSYPEVAKVLGCSVGTVKTQMFRALKTLAQKLPEFGGDLK